VGERQGGKTEFKKNKNKKHCDKKLATTKTIVCNFSAYLLLLLIVFSSHTIFSAAEENAKK